MAWGAASIDAHASERVCNQSIAWVSACGVACLPPWFVNGWPCAAHAPSNRRHAASTATATPGWRARCGGTVAAGCMMPWDAVWRASTCFTAVYCASGRVSAVASAEN